MGRSWEGPQKRGALGHGLLGLGVNPSLNGRTKVKNSLVWK